MNLKVPLTLTILVVIVAMFAGTAQAYNIAVPQFPDSSLAAGTATTATSAWTAAGWTVGQGGSSTYILNDTGLSPYLAASPDGKNVAYALYKNGGPNYMYPTNALFTLQSGYTYSFTMNMAGPKGGASQPAVLGGSTATGFGGPSWFFTT